MFKKFYSKLSGFDVWRNILQAKPGSKASSGLPIQGWDCKDDLKLFKYNDSIFWLSLLSRRWSFFWFCKERNKFKVAESHKCTETDSINSVQSSIKSHCLWVTLFLTQFNLRHVDRMPSVSCSHPCLHQSPWILEPSFPCRMRISWGLAPG